MTKGFDDVSTTSTASLRDAKRRKVELPVILDEQDVANERALDWIKRAQLADVDTVKAPWRKKKPSYRVSSKNWSAYTDCQIRTSSCIPGWSHFARYPQPEGGWPEDSPWNQKSWRQWPHCDLGIDLGSDGLSGSSGLMYEFFLNLTRWPDFDHGQQRAVFAALKAVGFHDLMMLLSVSWNFPNGPMNNDYRWHQLNDAHDSIRKNYQRGVACFSKRGTRR